MSFTILFAVLALLVLMLVFGFTYAVKGWKTALVSAGMAFLILTGLFIAVVYAITSSMPN